MASTSSYNLSGVLYDSDSEAATYDGNSYEHYLNSKFKDETFNEPYLARYIGKGPSLERVLLIIPSVSRKVTANYEDALRYVINEFDEYLVNKYSLIIVQTCISWTDSNSYYFVNQWYNMLPTSKKKNLLKVYLIHAPISTKTLLTLSTPFNSSKAISKVEFVENISDIIHKLELNKKYLLRYFPYVVQRTEEINLGISKPLTPFGTELWVLAARLGQRFKDFKLIPPVLANVLEHLETSDFLATPNLINLQCDAPTLYEAVTNVENMGENYAFKTPAEAVSVFKLLLDTQPCGILGPKALSTVKNALVNKKTFEELQEDVKGIISDLRAEHAECVFCVVKTLRNFVKRSDMNGMSLRLVSKAMAPSFFRAPTPDAYVYMVSKDCEKLTYSIIEKPHLYFSPAQGREPSTKLVRSEDPDRKRREGDRERERDREHRSKDKLDKHGTRHKSKESVRSEASKEPSKSDKGHREDSKQREEGKHRSERSERTREHTKHREGHRDPSASLVSKREHGHASDPQESADHDPED